jgi:hypothetical protein
MNKKNITFILILLSVSTYFFIEYGNYFLALNTFNIDQVSNNISDMNCLLNSPINNIIMDFKSFTNVFVIPEVCNIYYTKLSYIKNLLFFISLNYIFIILYI